MPLTPKYDKLLQELREEDGGASGLVVPVEIVSVEPAAADRDEGWLIWNTTIAVLKIRDTVAGLPKWREIGGAAGGNKFGSAKFGSAKFA